SQVRDFLGLPLSSVPADFVMKWLTYAEHLGDISLETLFVGMLSLAILLVWPKITRKIPGPLVAILGVTAVVQFFHLPVDTIFTRFGEVPNKLPTPHILTIDWAVVKKMFSPAITIALLGAIESLLSAVVADGMLGTRHRSNMELVAQGVGNVVSPVFA